MIVLAVMRFIQFYA